MSDSRLDGKCGCDSKILRVPRRDSRLPDRSSIGPLSVRRAGNLTDSTLDAADIALFYSGGFQLNGGKQGNQLIESWTLRD